MEASKTIRHQIGPNGESGKKMEWVTPKISPLEAVKTHGKPITQNTEDSATLANGVAVNLGPS